MVNIITEEAWTSILSNEVAALRGLLQELVDGVLKIPQFIGKGLGVLKKGKSFRHYTD